LHPETSRIRTEARLGAVGSSGNSTEPHLHFHVCNSADPLMCAGIPVQWDRPFATLRDLPRAAQSGGFMKRLEN
jgi:murein DD-endopeptidase MepM/ murein hydrolase activator NlpD